MNLMNESELVEIYISFIYRSISFYRHLKITCKLCKSVRLEVTGITHGTLPPLTIKASSNINLLNIFDSTLNAGSLSFVIN